MKTFFLAFFLLFQGTSLYPSSSKPTFRALIVGDTLTVDTKESLQKDVLRMQKNLEVVSRKIGSPLNLCTLIDHNASIDNIKIGCITCQNRQMTSYFFTSQDMDVGTL